MNVFDEMGKYWAEIADKSQTENQIQFIKKILPTKGLLLDFACGTGRHLIGLSKEEFDVVGVDISSNLLKIAKNRFKSAQLVRGDIRFLPFKPNVFSAAISMDNSVGYLPLPKEDLQSLNELYLAMCKNGVLVVDVFNRERLIKRYGVCHKSSWREYPSFFLLQNRTVDANGEKLHDTWNVRDKTDGQIKVFNHNVRLYERMHLQRVLEEAGFLVSEVYGDYDGKNFSSVSNRLIFLACSK